MNRKEKYINIFAQIFIFTLGGAVYAISEIFCRGYTHMSMFLAGGLAFALICRMYADFPKMPAVMKCILSAVIITCIELAFGMVVNDLFGWNVWDYSGQLLNLYGQICLKNCLIWLLVSTAAFPIPKFFAEVLFAPKNQLRFS